MSNIKIFHLSLSLSTRHEIYKKMNIWCISINFHSSHPLFTNDRALARNAYNVMPSLYFVTLVLSSRETATVFTAKLLATNVLLSRIMNDVISLYVLSSLTLSQTHRWVQESSKQREYLISMCFLFRFG